MRIWSRQNQPGDHQPTVTSRRGAMTDEAFDDLARTAGSCASRRGALKVLLLGVAGAAVGGGVSGGVLAASAPGQSGLSTSAVRRRAMQAGSGQLATAQTAGITCNAVIPAQCCTSSRRKPAKRLATMCLPLQPGNVLPPARRIRILRHAGHALTPPPQRQSRHIKRAPATAQWQAPVLHLQRSIPPPRHLPIPAHAPAAVYIRVKLKPCVTGTYALGSARQDVRPRVAPGVY